MDDALGEPRAHDRPVKDVIVTVVVAIVLTIAFMYLLLSLAFSGWRDPAPTGIDDPAVPSERVSSPTLQPAVVLSR